MGHFHSKQYCKEINKHFYRYGRVTIKEILDDFEKRKVWMSCSEAAYEERDTMALGVEMIFGIWEDEHQAIEPVPELLTERQRKIFRKWKTGMLGIGRKTESDYDLFDSIYWQRKPGFFAAGGLPVYSEITN